MLRDEDGERRLANDDTMPRVAKNSEGRGVDFDKRNRPGLDEAVVTGGSTEQWRAEDEIEQDDDTAQRTNVAGEGGV